MSSERVRMLAPDVGEALLGRKESWTRRMFELGAQLRGDGGGPVHDLSLGNPSLEPPDAWHEAVVHTLRNESPGMHRYMTNAGFPEVRDFIAKREAARYHVPFGAQHVVMTVGAAGAINVALRALVTGGERVAVPVPFFPEYEHYTRNVGASLQIVPSARSFDLDLAAWDRVVGDDCRAVLLNSPNNPSGAIYSRSALQGLADRLERKNRDRDRPIVVLEDSPYRDLVHDGSPVPSMVEVYPHTLLITSHSKDLGLAGERIGYLAVSPHCESSEWVGRAAAFCNRVLGFVNAPALMQRVLPRVLGDPDARVDIGVYAARCRRMAQGLRDLGFEVAEPRAGFFVFPRLPTALTEAGCHDIELTERMLARRTLVVPGTAFGAPDHLRLSVAAPDEAIDGALAAFAAELR